MMTKIKCILLFSLAAILLTCGKADQQDISTTDADSFVSDSLQKFISYSSNAVLGETVYVPVYSHIYQQNRSRTFNLTTTLSIRNTDLNAPIIIKKVYYYDSDGNLVHRYLDEPQTIDPLSSTSFVIEEEDLRGGVGANYLVLWEAEHNVNQPIFEAVMISTAQNQGISFVSVGRIIDALSRTSE
ncbi:DUF3124 domain-containing protein [Aliifodinibius sp. S!AR15-10]|uniref:DUF3124 domain-containing protein n=1 Tax=Aliifodinibius sp. S!AR15-10 TaxID=2950437 RepID=UPI002856FAC8|nr:DUF3124 domain-containing protein [Aliifodinibius sp. S!AR15-10]MDR8390048.1 DUF3124 domain-containing protein [Aliifodinibius sp. S!AR15-10]